MNKKIHDLDERRYGIKIEVVIFDVQRYDVLLSDTEIWLISFSMFHFSAVRVLFACHDPSYLLSCEIHCLLFFTSGSKGNAGARVQQGEIFIALQHSETRFI